jgi:hypothetical protein
LMSWLPPSDDAEGGIFSSSAHGQIRLDSV